MWHFFVLHRPHELKGKAQQLRNERQKPLKKMFLLFLKTQEMVKKEFFVVSPCYVRET